MERRDEGDPALIIPRMRLGPHPHHEGDPRVPTPRIVHPRPYGFFTICPSGGLSPWGLLGLV